MHVEIWSEVTCTRYYIRKRRFKSALANIAHCEQGETIWC